MRHAISALIAWLSFGPAVASQPSQRTLTFEDRVVAQRAIEQVYWNHRLWPKDNPRTKPPLSYGMSDDAIRAKVEDYLKKSHALETWWRRPVSEEQLQAEMDRMARNSRDPGVLREIFAALGNDPVLIAETLARQTLVDRLIRNWYANDTRFHADVRAKAAAALLACTRVDCMKSMAGAYREMTLKTRGDDEADGDGMEHGDVLRLDSEERKQEILTRPSGREPK